MTAGQNALIRSGQTRRYYENLRNACGSHLRGVNDPGELLRILGWVLRLMRYYRVEPKRAANEGSEAGIPPRTEPPAGQKQVSRQPKPKPLRTPPKPPPKPSIRVGDKLNATILRKEGICVTVKLQTPAGEEISFEQPYYPGRVGAKIKVKVRDVDSDGRVNKASVS